MVATSPASTFEPFLVMTLSRRAPTFGIAPEGRGATTPSAPFGAFLNAVNDRVGKLPRILRSLRNGPRIENSERPRRKPASADRRMGTCD